MNLRLKIGRTIHPRCYCLTFQPQPLIKTCVVEYRMSRQLNVSFIDAKVLHNLLCHLHMAIPSEAQHVVLSLSFFFLIGLVYLS